MIATGKESLAALLFGLYIVDIVFNLSDRLQHLEVCLSDSVGHGCFDDPVEKSDGEEPDH